jgi:hypothetical protein
MWEVTLSPRVQKKSKLHVTLIVKAAMEIERKETQIRYKTYQQIIGINGNRIFLAYEFQEDDVLYVTEARYSKEP